MSHHYVCISIHDMAPSTWTDCARLLAMVDELGSIPLTLLVVPDYHRHGRLDAFPDFVKSIDTRLTRGDEVALHGYYHIDDAPSPHNLRQWVARRIFTQSEGEFSALPVEDALHRLEQGVALLERLGWPIKGFVPPAWLLSDAARDALSHFAFTYFTTWRGIHLLTTKQFMNAPALTYSTRSYWRRGASRTLNDARMRLACDHPLLRISLHPADARFHNIMTHWRQLIVQTLDTRIPLTKAEWVDMKNRQ
ncbi:MAG TPA: polysaccharide deacetylase family protein [Burkholderiales bacterium]|nr:polysaccharide deacetylase family protein [Burkholderiales bacterium]